MAALTVTQLADIGKTTLKNFKKLSFAMLATELQNYECMSHVLKKERADIVSGEQIRRDILMDKDDNAQMVKLYQEDNVNIPNMMQYITVPWRHATTTWVYERRELLMNRDPSRIQDLLKNRRIASMVSLADVLENQFYHAPPSSADETEMFGLCYWITQSDTTGFNGANHTNFASGKGGINSTTHSRWKNFTSKYASVTYTDLISNMREAFTKMKWMSPVDFPDIRRGKGQRYRNYAPYSVVSQIEDIGRGQNENLGPDVAEMDGRTVIRGHPIVWLPKLDDSAITNAPVYSVDYSHFHMGILKGDYLVETGPQPWHNAVNTMFVKVDLTGNFYCTDLRKQAVHTTGADADAT